MNALQFSKSAKWRMASVSVLGEVMSSDTNSTAGMFPRQVYYYPDKVRPTFGELSADWLQNEVEFGRAERAVHRGALLRGGVAGVVLAEIDDQRFLHAKHRVALQVRIDRIEDVG